MVLAAIAFALSTDYGVFLLARIAEARRSGLPEREAVAAGMEHTGRLITSASVLLAVAIDAFVVRTLLVPSLMALLGRANWWAPAPLRRLHDRIGPGEADTTPSPGPAPAGQLPAARVRRPAPRHRLFNPMASYLDRPGPR